MHKERGLTLLELVTAVAIAVILVGIAVPSFAKISERTRGSTVSHALTTSLMSARMAAVARRHPVSVCPSRDGIRCDGAGDWSQGWIVFDDAQRTGQPSDITDVFHRTDSLGTGVRLTGSTGRHYVRYQPNGRSSGTNISFRLCSATDHHLIVRVVVANTGRARAERPKHEIPCIDS